MKRIKKKKNNIASRTLSISLVSALFISIIAAYCFALDSRTDSLLQSGRDRWQQPEKIMDAVGIKPGMVIGEAGAGRGYFTFKMAQRLGKIGKIYANDIVQRELDYIKDRCKKEGIENIETILGEVEDPLFPKGEMDLVIMVYVFHDLEKPVAFLKNIKPCLKPGAIVVIVDGDPEKQSSRHFLKKETVLEKIEEANYELVRIETFLPRDSIYICHPKDQ